MSDQINDIVIPVLREIQKDISGLKSDVSSLKLDVASLKSDVSILKESVIRIDSRIGTMENYMAGFHNHLNWHGTDLEELRGRIEALEKSKEE